MLPSSFVVKPKGRTSYLRGHLKMPILELLPLPLTSLCGHRFTPPPPYCNSKGSRCLTHVGREGLDHVWNGVEAPISERPLPLAQTRTIPDR